jgi:hypothetical protein
VVARWRHWAFGCALGCAAFGFVGHASASEPTWLRVAGAAECSPSPDALAARIRAAAIGTPRPDLAVRVELRGRVTAQVQLTRGAQDLGTKRIEAADCGEVVDAVVAVVALALSVEPPPEPTSSPRSAVPEPRPPAPVLPPAPPLDVDRAASAAPEAEVARWRLSLSVGPDRGTLREPTLFGRVGAALRAGPGELRAALAYAAPSLREEVGTRTERTRADFAAAAFDYCHGLDRERWLGACAGLQLGLGRISQLTRSPQGSRIEQEHLEPRASVLASLLLAYRAVALQPELELAAQVPLLGEPAQDRSLGYRALFGGSVQF